MKTLMQFIEENPNIIKDDDWDRLSEKANDAIFCRNIDYYFLLWLKENGVDLIRNFHNSKSDINPMEDQRQEEYLSDFKAYLDKL